MRGSSLPPGSLPYVLAHRPALAAASDPVAAYVEAVSAEYEEVLAWLPGDAHDVVEVGCGLGLFAALLAARYPRARVTLVDGDGPPRAMSGWYHPVPSPSTSRALVDQLFASRGLAPPRWADAPSTELHADLVASFFSWGFHYSLSTYPNITGDTVLLDVRAGREPEAEARFGPPAGVVRDRGKYRRLAWRRR